MGGVRMRRSFIAVAALGIVSACGTTADAPPGDVRAHPELTLGQDLYGLACNRLGASVLTEDLEGTSYRRLCFPGAGGVYADTVDQTRLPVPTRDGFREQRRLSIAKLEALARRRNDVIRALDTAFDDTEIPVPYEPGRTIGNHEALREMLGNLVTLYGSNPLDEPGSTDEPLFPSVTRSLGRLFAAFAGEGDPILSPADPTIAADAQAALSRISGRQSYRPLPVLLGALRPLFGYPELRAFAEVVGSDVGPGGPHRADFQNLLGAVQAELATSTPSSPAIPVAIDSARAQPSRPRTKLEFAAATFLSAAPSYNHGVPGKLLVSRDARGTALPRDFSVAADGDGDGLADTDPFGRYVTSSGTLAPVDPPFPSPLFPVVNGFDPEGRALDPWGQLVYRYVDLSETLLSRVLHEMGRLVTTDTTRARGSMAELLRGAFPLWGASVKRPASWASGGEYSAFDTTDSALVDLVHAAGQLIAHPDSDLWLALVEKAFTDHPDVAARLMGAVLRIREISNARPDIALAPEVTIWDEMQEWLVKVARNPVLFGGLVRALADPDFQAFMPGAVAQFAVNKDRLTYDPENINGAPLNLTTGVVELPRTPVDRSIPTVGDNTSILQRSLAMIHDVNGVNACNKEGAKIEAEVGGIRITFPALGGFRECELFYFPNMGLLYLDSILGQARMQIRNNLLDGLVQAFGGAFNIDQIFESSSGVTGLSLTPGPVALNRLVFFGARSSRFDPLFGGMMPDRDPLWTTTNLKTDRFIAGLIDAVSTSVCPDRTIADPAVLFGQLQLADCHSSSGGDPSSVVRLRDPGTIFAWETFDFLRAMRPMLQPFKDGSAGELFLELVDILNRHWPGPEHGAECSRAGSFRRGATDYNPMYCAESGVNRYEPLIADIVRTDLLPALAAMSQVVEPLQITDVRRSGATLNAVEVLRGMTLAFFDPDVSATLGVVDRKGERATTAADRVTVKPQTTPFDLFAHALQRNDDLLKGTDRFDGWRRARSTLVDTFFGVTGTGTQAVFTKPTVPAILTLVRAVREQINANCPDREISQNRCDWAVRGMTENAADTIGAADFSTILHLVDALMTDPATRKELEGLLSYLVDDVDPVASQGLLTSVADVLQLLGDTETMSPLYRAVSTIAAPAANGIPASSPGAVDRILTLLSAVVDETAPDGTPRPSAFDPYRTLPRVLRRMVDPVDPNDASSFSPIEILMDTIAEVNRIDASLPGSEPLDAADYQAVFRAMRDVMTSRTRGLEQVYRIVNGRSDR